MAEATLLGDLRERADGSFGGWCWAPERPTERLIVDLLVNDTAAASIVAATFRRDLLSRGIGDGRHGFTLRLPANFPEASGEYFLTARERRSGTVFGRVLRAAPGGARRDGGAAVDRLAAAVDDLWQRLATARTPHGEALPSARFRGALGDLAVRLAARSGHAIWRPPPIVLPDLPMPALTVVLAVADAAAALRQIAALAPAARLAEAEVLAVDAGADPDAALLPARVRNLRYLRVAAGAPAVNLAAAAARGARLLLLDPPAEPSAAALLACSRVAARLPGLLLGPSGAAAVARVAARLPVAAALPARLGVTLCIERAAWPALGPLDPALHDGAGLEYADLAFRAQLLGLPVHALTEPHPAGPTAPPSATVPAARVRQATAAFAERWGGAHA